MGAASLSTAGLQALFDVAAAIGARPEWLYKLIHFETAGTFDPLIRNYAGSSGRGLIQFMDATAKGLGYAGSADLVDRHPTVEGQLRGPVLAYFKTMGMPYKTPQDLYMTVFLPKYRKAAADTVIYQGEPEKQATFRRYNPGIKTVGDYVRKVEGKIPEIGGWVPVAAAGLVGLVLLKILGAKKNA